ncbi:hypothetical protein AMAG_16842 [Allomyces macrogynus ATCC 38327]|uniref:Uncharacterized protein n=1 Tax=Allomyces macrogynus (strain ATCC 38327) TaxID=578462 RepID=A0A0L0TC16_ALLM3|nr:hypothetical protein AMAG_16842 [Allomyces macrogynus ATCC 38327]|eukprot:KNE72358.1 hypothetical protein AMAG_16842 [Allomyces macrogynus ATCC 38327]
MISSDSTTMAGTPDAQPTAAPGHGGTSLTPTNQAPSLYGPNRDNNPLKFRFPQDAMQKDFYCNLRPPGAPLSPWSSTTKDTFLAHNPRQVRETRGLASQVRSFDSQVHFNVGRDAPLCSTDDAAHPYLTVADRDYVPHPWQDPSAARKGISHENKYPPVFRDESALAVPRTSLYGTSYVPWGPGAGRRGRSAAEERLRLRGDNITFDATVATAEDWKSVTQRTLVPLDPSVARLARRDAEAVASLDKKSSNVLDRPDGEVADGKSTNQHDFKSPIHIEQPDLTFKKDLEATHLSLAVSDVSPDSFQSLYKSTFQRHTGATRPARKVNAPPCVLLQEDAPTTTTPMATTAQATFQRPPVARHQPIHQSITTSFVFQGLPTENGAAELPGARQTSVTAADYYHGHRAPAPPRAFRTDKSHVLDPADADDTADSAGPETARAYAAPPDATQIAPEFRALRRAARAQVQAQAGAHFDVRHDPPEGVSSVKAMSTTAMEHHGAAAQRAVHLLAPSTGGSSLRVRSDALGLQRLPVVPDRSYATSLHNTVGWGADSVGQVPKLDGVSVARAAYVAPVAVRVAPVPAVVGNADHLMLADAVDRLALGQAGVDDGTGAGSWMATTRKTYVAPAVTVAALASAGELSVGVPRG